MSRYKPYPAYKDSGVEWLGQVPEHWIISKVKWEFEARLGKMLQPAQNNDSDVEVPYHKAVSVQWETVASEAPETMWGSLKDIETYQIRCGDLLICEGGEVGRAAIFNEDVSEPLIIQNSLHRVRPKNDNLNEVLLRIMQTVHSARWFEVLCSKATIVHFTGEKLGDLAFPVAPINEQKAIVAYLDRETSRIDALANAKTRFIERLREKRQALITHAVTKGLDPNVKMKHSGVEWLGQVPEHWIIKRLKYLLKPNGLVRGPFGGDLKKEIFVDQGIKVYEQKNAIYQSYELGDSYITEDKFSDMGRFQVHADDYIMSCSGTIGKTYRIPVEAPTGIINQALLVIRFNTDIINDFADWLFVADFFTTQIIDNSQGGAMKNLVGTDVFKSIFLQLPPLEEQRRIATFLNLKTTNIDALIEKTELSIELLKERRSALIAAAVTGQIDLREAEE